MATIADKIDQDDKAGKIDISQNDGVIEEALDLCLGAARRCKKYGTKEFPNVLFVGEGGSGKTSRIKAWAESKGLNLKEVHTADLDQQDMGGATAPDKTGTKVVRLSPTEMNSLDQPNTVLFLDEYNRGKPSIRGTLLTLIENHTVYDQEAPGFRRELRGFLFTVAAVNPFSPDYETTPLDAAEESRFFTVAVDSDPIITLKWFEKTFNQEDYVGSRALAKALLSSREFVFTSSEEMMEVMANGNHKPLSARTLTRLLITIVEARGGATKENLLKYWNAFCDSGKKAMAEKILTNYKDVDDKANQLLRDHDTDSDVFKKRESLVDKLKNLNL